MRLMGIINLSRESFYKGSVAGPNEVLSIALDMQEEGADMIDLGAVSTAPGSPPVSEATERERLFPALKEILDNLDITVSIDTQRAAIAEDALSCGAACINDVSGLCDPEMAACVAKYDGSLIIMASEQRAGRSALYESDNSIARGKGASCSPGGRVSGKDLCGPGDWQMDTGEDGHARSGPSWTALGGCAFWRSPWSRPSPANPSSGHAQTARSPSRGSPELWRPRP